MTLITARISQYDNTRLQQHDLNREIVRQNAQLAQCNIYGNVAAMAKVWLHRHAFLFPRETANFYYMKGNVRIGNLQPLPNELLNLCNNDDSTANRFKKDIRQYVVNFSK